MPALNDLQKMIGLDAKNADDRLKIVEYQKVW